MSHGNSHFGLNKCLWKVLEGTGKRGKPVKYLNDCIRKIWTALDWL